MEYGRGGILHPRRLHTPRPAYGGGTPTELKEREVPGAVWRVHCTPLLASLDLLETLPIVRNVSLSGNHLRAITEENSSAQNLEQALDAAGLHDVRIQETAPTLEDVFLSLAGN